jgi:hypothetical protein
MTQNAMVLAHGKCEKKKKKKIQDPPQNKLIQCQAVGIPPKKI